MNEKILVAYDYVNNPDNFLSFQAFSIITLNVFRPLLYDEDLSSEEKTFVEYEIYAHDVLLNNRTLAGDISEQNSNYLYPIPPKDFALLASYLQTRVTTLTNPILKVKYYEILWHYFKKPEWGLMAYKSNIDSLDYLLSHNKTPNAYEGNFLHQAFNIANTLKNDELLKEASLKIVSIVVSNDLYNFQLPIIALIASELRKIKPFLPSDFSEILFKKCNLLFSLNIFQCQEFTLACNKIVSKLSINDSQKWFLLLGEIYRLIAENELTDDYIKLLNYQKASIYFKKAHAEEKERESLGKCKTAWEGTQKFFKKYSYFENLPPQEITKFENETIKIAKILEQFSIQHITNYFGSPLCIVDKNTLNAPQPVAYQICSIQLFDEHGNQPTYVNTQEDIKKHWINEQYRIAMILLMKRLYSIINHLVIKRKLSYELLINHLQTGSWLSPLYKNKTNWLEVIKPILYEYFKQIDLTLLSNYNYQPIYMLCMDALVVKMEGMIRDLFNTFNINTKRSIDNGKGEVILQEADLNYLLYLPQAKSVFQDYQLDFLRFVFIEQDGFNLRNTIAHSLSTNYYSLPYMNLVFIALIIVCSFEYDMTEISESN